MATKRVEHEARVCEAPDCDVEFVPARSTAKYHTATCQRRASRSRKAAERQAQDDSKSGSDAEHGLVKALRKELIRAGELESFDGQMALELARRAVAVDSNLTAFDKLEAARRRALGKVAGEAGTPAPAPVEEDDVTKARAARDRKRAGLGEASAG